jgi:hypothetical protein
LGFTQYFFGAVVLILKQIFRSEGFFNFIEDVTADVKGPEKNIQFIYLPVTIYSINGISSSVADPDPVLFLPHGSGIQNNFFPDPGSGSYCMKLK